MDKDSLIFRAIERGLWEPFQVPSYRYDREFDVDRAAFTQALKRVWLGRDWVQHAVMADAFVRGARPDPKHLARLCFALAATGRHEQAVELLKSYRNEAGETSRYWFDLASALAGAGRLKEASKALRTCLELEPGLDWALALRAELAPMLKLEKAIEDSAEWGYHRDLIERLVKFGALRRAAEVARLYLHRRRQIDPRQLEPMLAATQFALAMLAPEEAFSMVGDLQYAYPEGPERRLLASTQRLMLGEETAKAALAADQECEQDRSLRVTTALALLVAGKRAPAIERAGRVGERFKTSWDGRLMLAHAISQEVLARHPVAYRSGGGRKIFNLVTFNNERDLLRAKLTEEAPWVDHFVIVEANQTFTGIPKPLYFEAWKSEFAEFQDKIIHVKVESFPEWATTPWARDFYQRDMAIVGASGLWGVDDLVLITDADEILDRSVVEGFDGEYAAMLMETFRYFLNYHSTQGAAHTGVVIRAKYLQRFSPSYARFVLRSSRYLRNLEPCGWHFTSMADPAGLAAKMRSYAHQEHAHMDQAYFEKMFAKIRSGREQALWEFWPIDERYPASIRQNREQLKDLILPVEDLATA